VRSEAERLLAARLAEGVPGVRAVVNQLVVGEDLG
jgi:osmotically-inducible protein OsmY